MKDAYKAKYIEPPIVELIDMKVALMQQGRPTKSLVKGIDLSLRAGEMVGLVGESGSGKSLTAAAIMGILPKQLQMTGGQIKFRGMDMNQMKKHERQALLGKEMSLVFQDHQGSLTPHKLIGKQMVEMIRFHLKLKANDAKQMSLAALEDVQLPAKRVFDSYSFQLSGGQGQRVAIAMAMLLHPALLIADEPTTALDVLTQYQILELLSKLQQETKCSILFISHDLAQVVHRTDRTAVMYGGHLVEEGPTEVVKAYPQHPYTKALMRARPTLNDKARRLWTISGEPGLIAEKGCPFALRCPSAIEECNHQLPLMKELNQQQRVACHLVEPEERKIAYEQSFTQGKQPYKIV
jgi:oligopeptide/dipeptide ABC transporter ATP-binding protein